MTKVSLTYIHRYSKTVRRVTTKITIRSNDQHISGNAIWDTGATHLMITRRVIDALCLLPVDVGDVEIPFGTNTVNGYRVNVVLPNNGVIQDVVGYEVDIGDEDIIALIGMNIITRGDFKLVRSDDGMVFEFTI